MANEAELLADLLDGRLEAADVPPELAELAELADAVSAHITLIPPTEAFREALREQVLETAGGAAAGGTTGGGVAGATGTGTGSGATAITATSATGGLPAFIAGLTATAVLAAGGISAADRAVPGDLLYDTKRGIESVQLAIASDERDVELLVEFATERVREAVGLTDVQVVNDLLLESAQLLEQALALATQQGRSIEELLGPYTGALMTLASRTEDPGVAAHVQQLLEDLGVKPARGATGGLLDPDTGTGLDATDGTSSGRSSGTSDSGSSGGEGADGEGSDRGPLDELDDTLEDPVNELGETLDDTLDGLEEPLEEPVDDLGETIDDLDDAVDETVDELGDVVEDAVGEAGDVADDATTLLGD